MTNKFEMNTLYKKIQALGFTKKNIKAMLPDWWNDNIANTQAGFLEAASLLAKSFSLDFSSLVSGNEAKFDIPNPNFKTRRNIDLSELESAVALSSVAAKAVLKGFDTKLNIEGLTPEKIRNTLLSRGNRWIDFRTLLEYCWEIGIPVLHLDLFTKKKMQGLAISLNERPVIILTSKKKYGYLVFDLAHELGHILAGHTKNDLVIDEHIFEKYDDPREKEANDLALKILIGDNIRYTTTYVIPDTIAEACIAAGKRDNIDPAHLALNIGHSMNNWSTIQSSLNIIRERLNISTNDPSVCKEAMLERLDFDEMGDFEHPMRVITGSLNKGA